MVETYPPSHSSRPNLWFKPLNDRDEEVLPPTVKDWFLGQFDVELKCANRTQGSIQKVMNGRQRQGRDSDQAAGGVSCQGLRQETWDKPSS
jgi:hypothetical protein